MSIRIRLALYLLVALLVMLALALYAGNQQKTSFEELYDIRSSTSALIHSTEKIDTHFQKQLLSWSNLLLNGQNPEQYYIYLQAFYFQERETRQAVNKLRKRMIGFTEALTVMDEFSRVHSSLGIRFRKAIKIYNQSDNPIYDTEQFIKGAVELPVLLLSHVKENLIKQRENEVSLAEAAYKKTENIIVMFAIMSVLLLIIVFIWLMDISVGKPLSKSVKIAGEVAEGDYSQRVEGSMPGEFNVFARAFNNMLDHLSKVNKDLEEKKVAAEQASRSKSEFLSNMSHEIRTPLNIVTGYSELLALTEVNEKQSEHIKAIQSGGASLLKIINDVLDLAKIESGKLSIENKPFNLNDFIEEIKNIFSKLVNERGLEFVAEIAADVPEVISLDEYRLKQILLNLLSNAIKFTEQGSVKLVVDISAVTADSRADIEIKIEDTGIGIPEDFQQKVFNQFEQKDGQDSRRYGGTGLGLSICQKLAGMLNGVITVSSVPGEGSVFTVRLAEVDIPGELAYEVKVEKQSVLFNRSKILIADDIKANRMLVKSYLTNQPFDFIEAENGKEAVELTLTHKPDLVIMDIKMPEMDGIEATKIIKANPALKGIYVIALSASSIKGEEVQEKELLFDDYLTKPIKMKVLVSSLMKFIGHEIQSG